MIEFLLIYDYSKYFYWKGLSRGKQQYCECYLFHLFFAITNCSVITSSQIYSWIYQVPWDTNSFSLDMFVSRQQIYVKQNCIWIQSVPEVGSFKYFATLCHIDGRLLVIFVTIKCVPDLTQRYYSAACLHSLSSQKLNV